jgi:hypothetical protein
MTSGFRSDANENCALLVYYAASSGNFLQTFRDNLSVPSSVVEKTEENCSLLLFFLFPGSVPVSFVFRTSCRMKCHLKSSWFFLSVYRKMQRKVPTICHGHSLTDPPKIPNNNNKHYSITLQFRLVHLILDKNLNTQSLLQHVTSNNTSNIFT